MKDKIYNDVVKIETIKEILDLAVKEAGDQDAFQYKDGDNVVKVTYKEFQNDTNYLYAVDIYRCEGILVDNNEIRINTDGGVVTTNGTGAAYGIQLTGWHANVVLSNNNITTANNGPNLGIYSQNSQASTALNITGNNINVTGRAGLYNYTVVAGMELQDTYDNINWNNIVVNNIGDYVPNQTYAFGISYCQQTIGPHTFNIDHNNVTVNNGSYAVYLLDEGSYGEVTLNNLTTVVGASTDKTGDAAVSAVRPVRVHDNN